METDKVRKIMFALQRSWSDTTCSIFDKSDPSYGQCGQTSIVIFERFGGEILKTAGWPGRYHFYNRIDGMRYDFTAVQFQNPIDSHKVEYDDIPSSPEEAEAETSLSQIEALKSAFDKALAELESG